MEPSSIKNLNLEQLQKPKTLIVIHYKNKRVSIPLFQPQPNITQYLYHQIEKFELRVLQPQQESLQPKSRNKLTPLRIVCFCSKEENNCVDLKLNILLSMVRLTHDSGRCRSDLKVFDITSYYNYIELQPYYMPVQKQLTAEYQLFTVLSIDDVFTAYLGRRVQDGRFFRIQVASGNNHIAEKEYNVLKLIKEQQKSATLADLGAIPQVEEVRYADGLIICVLEFCAGGTLAEKSNKSSEKKCFEYMKQLIWGVHTLHQNFNLLHRHLTLNSIHIDFHGKLKIFNYRHALPCFSCSYLNSTDVPKSYQDLYEIDDGNTPPEVHRNGSYNRFVDFYGVGAILSQICKDRKYFSEENSLKKIQRGGIEIAIKNLMSESLKDREFFTREIITELIEEKRNYSASQKMQEQYSFLSLKKLKIGNNFTLDDCPENGVMHQQVIQVLKPSHQDQIYYLHPGKKKDHSKKKNSGSKIQSKSKSKSKSKSRERKGSMENSGNLKSNFDTKSKNSKISTNTNAKSFINKSLSGKKTSVKQGKSISNSKQNKSKSKPKHSKNEISVNRPKIPIVKSPQKNPLNKCPEKFIKSNKQQEEYVSYLNLKIPYKNK